MGVSNLWPLFLLISIPLLILLYILKKRYKEEVISSSILWQEVYRNTQANTPWEKLRKNIMMFLQIIVLLLIIIALMNPFLKIGGKSYKNVIVVIDNSASMSAIYEDDKSRLDKGKELATEYIKSIKEGTNTYVVSFDDSSNLRVNGNLDKSTITKEINNIKQSYGSGDITESISFIEALGEGINEDFEVLLLSDREVSLGNMNGKSISLANTGLNASIDNISHKIVENEMKVVATITNRGSEAYNGDFTLYSDNDIIDVKTLQIPVGEKITLNFKVKDFQGEALKGELSKKDLIIGDNTYYHVVNEKTTKKILLVTEQNVFLEKSLSVLENVELYKTNSVSSMPNEEYDLYVFDDVMPEVLPSKGNVLFINPNTNDYFTVNKGEDKAIQVNAKKGQVSKYLEKTNFTVSQYNSIQLPYWGKSFLESNDLCMGFLGESNGQVISAISFDLHNSDAPLKREFPILIYELGDKLLSQGMLYKSNFKGGDEIIAKGKNLEDELEIVYADKKKEKVKAGTKLNSKESLGLQLIRKKEEKNTIEEKFAINFPSELESSLVNEAISENSGAKIESKIIKKGLNLAPIIILLALLVVLGEWVMYKKGY